LIARFRGESTPHPEIAIRSDLMAFFPQARASGHACTSLIEASYHDVPAGEPDLVDELALSPWPRRQWAARIYHALKPDPCSAPIIFEPLGWPAGLSEMSSQPSELSSLGGVTE
jgi:hypothetical protein